MQFYFFIQEATYCVDLNSWDLGFAVASIFVKVAASNKFQTSVFRNATNIDQSKQRTVFCVIP